jgi:hypothetical protein
MPERIWASYGAETIEIAAGDSLLDAVERLVGEGHEEIVFLSPSGQSKRDAAVEAKFTLPRPAPLSRPSALAG